VKADASFLSDKPAMLSDRIRETQCSILYVIGFLKGLKNKFNES
jgi:hypothetical protein